MIRRKGAEGCLPVLPEEKIEILVVLSQDPDAATRNTARATLSAWDSTELIRVLSNPAVPLDVLEFAARELVPQRIELAMALLENPALPEPLREALEDPATFSAKATPAEGTADPAAGRSDSQPGLQRETLLQKIGRMTVAEKINAALMGSREERTVLVHDSNKIVARAVLQSPKVSDQEIENIASMKSVAEEVLRLVASSRKFIRNYGVARSLLNNPRTPIDVGLPLINRLNERDLKELTRNKNVAEVLRSMAAKLIKQKEEANNPKLLRKH